VTARPPAVAPPTAGYVLGLADDALVAAQRMGEWVTRAPQIEEDVALANIGLDLLGQARSLLSHAGALLDPPRTEDDLAYLREASEFRNVHLVERPWTLAGAPAGPGAGTDFGVAMARLLVLSAHRCELYAALTRSTDETLAAVASKAVKEVAYHLDHATMWVRRLGDGTAESHERMQAALDAEWPFVPELFEADAAALPGGSAVDPGSLRPAFDRRVAEVLAEATLRLPQVAAAPGGGRRGEHTEHLAVLLQEMQGVARAHPGASW
jgi:ring-1,2-phenylacetyl-CoA epoxidase subunit PaaC